MIDFVTNPRPVLCRLQISAFDDQKMRKGLINLSPKIMYTNFSISPKLYSGNKYLKKIRQILIWVYASNTVYIHEKTIMNY